MTNRSVLKISVLQDDIAKIIADFFQFFRFVFFISRQGYNILVLTAGIIFLKFYR